MKSSQLLWVDEKVKWSPLRKHQLLTKHRYKGQAYLICTSPVAHWLFEIIEVKDLSPSYEACYLVGIASTKMAAVEQVGRWIDRLYNTQTLTYEAFIT